MLIEWVEHAARAWTVWLLLLLWADVNAPPNRVGHNDVFICDVSDFTSTFSRIGFNVNCFKWMIELDISKQNVFNAVVIYTWRNWTNAHTNRKVNFDIFDENILSAVREHLSTVTWFWNDGIVKIGDLKPSISCISTGKINSIGVQWEHWKFNIETLDVDKFF